MAHLSRWWWFPLLTTWCAKHPPAEVAWPVGRRVLALPAELENPTDREVLSAARAHRAGWRAARVQRRVLGCGGGGPGV